MSDASRSGGFILVRVEKHEVATSSSVRRRWCGVTSHVTAMPSAFAAPHELESTRRREVGDVETSAGELRDEQIARQRPPPRPSPAVRPGPRRAETAPSCIGEWNERRRVLAVLDDGLPKRPACS